MQDQIKRWADQLKTKFTRLKSTPEKAPETAPEEPLPEPFIPETKADLIWLLRRLKPEVLSDDERAVIASALSFKEHRVKELMRPKSEISFVYENDFLGPLMLDKLYQSGMSHFPVMNTKGQVVGVLHTAHLNSLEIKDTDRAKKYLDQDVFYLREDYTLEQALNAFLRTGSPFCIVINKTGTLVGLLTFRSLLEFLLGALPEDGFDKDSDLQEVAARK